jgi:hypothetical protein
MRLADANQGNRGDGREGKAAASYLFAFSIFGVVAFPILAFQTAFLGGCGGPQGSAARGGQEPTPTGCHDG